MESVVRRLGQDVPTPEFLARLATTSNSPDQPAPSTSGCGQESCASSRCRQHDHAAGKGEGGDNHMREMQLAKERRWGAVWQRIAGPPIVLFNYAIIFFLMHAYFMEALPWFEFSPMVRFVLSAPAAVLVTRLMYDYARAAFTRPGQPEGPCLLPVPMPREERKWCYVCNGTKLLRVHHCKVCRRCVTRMDHHCLYIANCVGLHNMHYFTGALLEAVLCLCVTSIWMLPLMIEVVCMNPDSPFGQASTLRRLHLLAAFLTSVVSLYLLSSVFWNAMEIVLFNETTLETMGNKTHKRQRPYFQGYYQNFREVFGDVPAWCGERLPQAIDYWGWLIDDQDFRL